MWCRIATRGCSRDLPPLQEVSVSSRMDRQPWSVLDVCEAAVSRWIGKTVVDAYSGEVLGVVVGTYQDEVEAYVVLSDGQMICCGHVNTA